MSLGLNFNRIPFGVKKDTGVIVDVGDVEQGRNCGCVCPGCQTPLIARKGLSNAWHFAHESRGTFEETRDACEHSLYVSLKLMARQLLQDAKSLLLPAWHLTEQVLHKVLVEPVALSRRIEFNEVEIETLLDGVHVDAAIVLKTSAGKHFPLGIKITYPSQTTTRYEVESAVTNPAASVLEINLEQIWQHIAHLKSGYREALSRLVIDEVNGKRWLVHHGYQAARHRLVAAAETSRQQQHEEAARRNPASSSRFAAFKQPVVPHVLTSRKEAWRYGCIRCRVRWTCLPASRIVCLQCRCEDFVHSVGAGETNELGAPPVGWIPGKGFD